MLALQCVADFARVQDHVRVKDFLDAFHQSHVGRSDGLRQIFHLAAADAVLAGNKSAALDSVVVQLHEILVDSLLELRFLQVVAALIDVQVSGFRRLRGRSS